MRGSKIVFLLFFVFILFCQFHSTNGQIQETTTWGIVPIGIMYMTTPPSQYQDDCKEYVNSNGEWVPTGNTNKYCCYYSWYDYWNDWNNKGSYYIGFYDQYYGPGDSVPTPNCTERVCISLGVWETRELDPSSCTQTCEHGGYIYLANWTRYGDDCYEYLCKNGSWEKTNNTDDKCCYFNDWYYWYDYWYYNDGYYGLHEHVSRSRIGCSDLTCVAKNTWESDDCKMCTYNNQQFSHMSYYWQNDCKEYYCDNGEWVPTGSTNSYCCYYSSYDGWTDWGNYDDDYLSVNKHYGPGEGVPTPNCTERICVGDSTWETREVDEANCVTCEFDGKLYRTNRTRFGNDCLEYVCKEGAWELGDGTDPQCCYYDDWPYWYDYYYGYYCPYRSGYYDRNGVVHRFNCSDLICVAKNTWQSDDCKLCRYKDVWYMQRRTVLQDDCREYKCDNGIWQETGYNNSYCCYLDYYEYSQNWSNVDYDYGDIDDYHYRSYGLYEAVPSPNCTEGVCVALNTWEYRDLDPAKCETCEYNGRLYRVNKTRLENDCYHYICRADHTWEKTDVTDQNCCRNDFEDYYYWWYYDSPEYNGTCRYYGGSDHFYYGYHGPQEIIVLNNCTAFVCASYYNWSTTDFDVFQSGACHHEGYLYGNNVTRFGNDCYEYGCRDGTWKKTGEDPNCCRYYYDYSWSWEGNDCVNYGNEYGSYGPQDTFVTSTCKVYECIGPNTWNATDLQMTDLGACSLNGNWYKNNSTRFGDDCLEYLCINGEWELTGQTDPYCCYNYYYYWDYYYNFDYWYDYYSRINNYHVGLNGTALRGECIERVCVSRDQWDTKQLNVSECCEENGYYFLAGQMRFKDDCYAYVCENGELKRTDNTHPECCNYNHYYDAIDGGCYSYRSGYYDLNATLDRYNCSDIQCVSRNFWESEDCKMCILNGEQYHHKRILMQDDCKEYRCENGEWEPTGVTDSYCCYSYYYGDYWYDYDVRYFHVGLNETVSNGDCTGRVCLSRGQWEELQLNVSECCEDNGYYHLPGQTRYKDDCYAYVCEGGELKKTINTHPRCCYLPSNYGDYWYNYGCYFCGSGYYSLNDTVSRNGCSDLQCTSRDVWESEDCKICMYDRWQYQENSTVMKDDCREYSCENGEWQPTGVTDDNCCYNYYYYYDYYYYWDYWQNYYYSHYTGPNVTVPGGGCTERVCVSRGQWETKQLNNSDCCEENGNYYIPGQIIFKDDCYAYVCEDGEIKKTNTTHPQCCTTYYYDYEINEAEQLYEKYSQRFRWWQYYDYADYNSVLNNNSFEYTLNQSRYNYNCRRKICIARDTWETQDETRHELCCEYNGVYYPPGKPTYKDDCIGYVCNDGNWVTSTYTDPACCRNPDWIGMDPSYYQYNDYYENWWVDYSFHQYWRNGEAESSNVEWYRLNKTRTNYECAEVKCAARETWEPTGVVVENCVGPLGCEFNGIQYNHTERLPGCMKVYCINGEWLQAGYIDPNCTKCYARWDPHLGTFDGKYYNYHGTCNYTLVQDGTSYTPQFGVFSEFINCWGAACVGPSTYKDSSGTVIEMGVDGRYAPELYMLYVNGVAYEIPDNTPRMVMEGTNAHPVMAWRSGGGCIRLLGSSMLAVQKCGSSLEIWVSSDFNNTLYGLCGLFNGDMNDDFTKRDLNIATTANDFGDSWEVTGNCFTNAGRKKRDGADEKILTVCDLDNTTKEAMHEKCEDMAQLAGDNVTEDEMLVMMGDCMFDMCTVFTNTSGDEAALGEILNEIMVSVQEIREVEEKTIVDDPIPTPPPVERPAEVTKGVGPTLSQPQQPNTGDHPIPTPPAFVRPPGVATTVDNHFYGGATEVSEEVPATPFQPLQPNAPAGFKCADGKCNMNIQVHVRIDLP